MSQRRDPTRIAIELGVYVFLYIVTAFLFGPLLHWLGGYLLGITVTGLLAACVSNGLAVRIFEQFTIFDVGLRWNAASGRNLALGLAGGIGSAALVLAPPLLTGAARLAGAPANQATPGSFLFVAVVLFAGSAGEEMLFRGYGQQTLIRAWGPLTILPVGAVFAALHAMNPNATWLGLANTAGFGMLFGYALLRSRDLWLPIGLHFGWNVTLPAFGVNVSGIKMGVTGYTMQWSAGTLWSGGEYGPEASILTSGALLALCAFLWKAPIRRQHSPLLDPSAETDPCEPGTPPSP